jgi:hypothetical protein
MIAQDIDRYPTSMTSFSEPLGANISVREYIYFMPHPIPTGTPIPYSTGLPDNNPLNLPLNGSEPTSTLVLTSPSSTFIDLRLLKPLSPDESPLPNVASNQYSIVRRLEWGFAGTSSSSPSSNDLVASHSVWTHWVDSRFAVGSNHIPADEGDMYAIDDEFTLEHGAGPNPFTGNMHSYEEMWRDVPIKACYPATIKFCAVLRLQSDSVRGLVIRLGQYCQGLVQHGEEVSIERWEFVLRVDENGHTAGGDWTRVARVGTAFLPCLLACRDLREESLGTVIKGAGDEWVVEEVGEWS